MAATALLPGQQLRSGEQAVVAATLVALAGLCAAAAITGLWKLLVIGLVSFGSMVVGAVLGLRTLAQDSTLVWAYGLTAGAMVASASAFLVPVAINRDPKLGGFGIAAGIAAGFALHVLTERFYLRTPVLEDSVVRLSMHALTAGIVIGAIYTQLPSIGLLLGLSIVSHKGPAGYAAAQSLHRSGASALPLVVPASGIGVPAIAVGLLGWPLTQQVNAVVFGFAGGVFLHLAIDFLPRVDDDQPAEATAGQRKLRLPSEGVAAVALGGAAVVLAWALIKFL